MSGPKPVQMTRRRLTAEEYRIAQERYLTDSDIRRMGFEPPTQAPQTPQSPQAPKAPRQLTTAEAEIAKQRGLGAEELQAMGFTLPDTPLKLGKHILRPGLQGAFLGHSDELRGGIEALGALLPGGRSPKQAYREGRDAERRALAEARVEAPKVSRIAELVGGVAVPGTGYLKVAKGAPTIIKALAGMGIGGTTGVVGGAGYSEGTTASEVAADAARTGGIGMAVGGTVPVAGGIFKGLAREAGITTAAGRAAKAQQAIDRAVYRAGGDPVNVQSGLGKGKTLVEAMGPAGDEILKGVQGLGDKSAREASIASQGMGEMGKKVFDAAQRAPEKSWAENLMSHLGPVGRGTYKVATGGARRSSRKEAETLMEALTKRQTTPSSPIASLPTPPPTIPPGVVKQMAEEALAPTAAEAAAATSHQSARKMASQLLKMPRKEWPQFLETMPDGVKRAVLMYLQNPKGLP